MFFRLISPLQSWREGSRLLSAKFLGGLLVVLLASLPFLENAQTGVIGAAVAIAWLMMWLSDRRDGEDQTVPIWTPIHLPLISYWAISLLATLISPVRVAAMDGMVKLTIYMLAFVSLSRLMRLGWRNIFIAAYLISALVASATGCSSHFSAHPN
jgi:putative inorganic carbon (HCO3(-)) transporter